ncbi:hypothetical protein HYW42_04755 [Candidatus Daviesbacteria bacterium]|nr:hypothetical protein [Candidatus Daviesbacteria bacterium]
MSSLTAQPQKEQKTGSNVPLWRRGIGFFAPDGFEEYNPLNPAPTENLLPTVKILGVLANFQIPNLRPIEGGLKEAGSAIGDLFVNQIGGKEGTKPTEGKLTEEELNTRETARHERESYQRQEADRIQAGEKTKKEAVKMAERFDPQGLFGIEQKLMQKAGNAGVSREHILNIGSIAYAIAMEKENLVITSAPEAMEGNPALSPKPTKGFDEDQRKIFEGGHVMSSSGGNAG